MDLATKARGLPPPPPLPVQATEAPPAPPPAVEAPASSIDAAVPPSDGDGDVPMKEPETADWGPYDEEEEYDWKTGVQRPAFMIIKPTPMTS